MATYILGAGGHAKVVYDAAAACGVHIDGLAVADTRCAGFNNIRVISEEDIVTGDRIILGIGDNRIRTLLFNELKMIKAEVLTIIHPEAWVSPNASLGEGSVVLAGAIVNHSAAIGKACIINTRAVVEHDCIVEHGAHVSPGAVLCGGVHVGTESWIGASSVVRENISIGRNCIIGAGSAVVKNVPDGTKGAGVPFRKL